MPTGKEAPCNGWMKKITGAIGTGLVLIVPVMPDNRWLHQPVEHKVINPRIFNDRNRVMNLGIKDVNG